MFTDISSRYVTRNPEILGGEPIIIGTRTSVRAIVGLWRLGIMPEEILSHFPHLTLAQVLDALSFYLDHQTEINDYIERNQVPDELRHPSLGYPLKPGQYYTPLGGCRRAAASRRVTAATRTKSAVADFQNP